MADHNIDHTTKASTDGHTPVMLEPVLAYLEPRSGGRYIDATFGGGGHTRELLERTGTDGQVLTLDADPAAIDRATSLETRYPGRLTHRQANFGDIERFATDAGFTEVDGILFDLGLSSFQFDEGDRGFSLHSTARLDMRLDPELAGPTAWDMVNTWDESDLTEILFTYGEESRARRIIREIARRRRERPIETGRELADVIQSAVGGRRGARIHPATKTFQALRIAVNRELDVLEHGLTGAMRLLHTGGRIVVISFHSLEDRIVKQFFQWEARDCICPPDLPVCRCDHKAQLRILTRRPVVPDAAEQQRNPRSRSAKLRAAERI